MALGSRFFVPGVVKYDGFVSRRIFQGAIGIHLPVNIIIGQVFTNVKYEMQYSTMMCNVFEIYT